MFPFVNKYPTKYPPRVKWNYGQPFLALVLFISSCEPKLSIQQAVARYMLTVVMSFGVKWILTILLASILAAARLYAVSTGGHQYMTFFDPKEN